MPPKTKNSRDFLDKSPKMCLTGTKGTDRMIPDTLVLNKAPDGVHPLHEQLSRKLEVQISTAVLGVGAALPSERELCEIYSVSRNTVRQAMRNLQAKGLISRLPGKGSYVAFRSSGADEPRSRSNEIAFFVAREAHADSTLAGIHRGLEQVLHDPGFHLIALINGSSEAEERNLRYLAQNALGGAIILPSSGYGHLGLYFEFQKTGLPFVLIHRSLPGIRAHLVKMDDRKGSYLLTRHLLEQGHRRIAFILGRECSVMCERFEGFRDALAEFKLPYDPALKLEITAEEARGAIENGRRMVSRLLAANLPFTAINAGATPLAEGASMALGEAGLSIGEDVALVGFENENKDQWSTATLSLTTATVTQEQVGRVAAQILLDILERRQEPLSSETVIPAEIVVRESSSCPLKEMRCRRPE